MKCGQLALPHKLSCFLAQMFHFLQPFWAAVLACGWAVLKHTILVMHDRKRQKKKEQNLNIIAILYVITSYLASSVKRMSQAPELHQTTKQCLILTD